MQNVLNQLHLILNLTFPISIRPTLYILYTGEAIFNN